MKLEEAKNLKYCQVIYAAFWKNADGSPERWRVNGKVKTWKRDASRVTVPIKNGLYSFNYLTQYNLHDFYLTEGEVYDAENRRQDEEEVY